MDLETFKSEFGRIRSQVERMLEAEAKRERKEAPRFNVFETLGIQYAEVTTHSRMIAWLLDPGETHGQGDRFLYLFLRRCLPKSRLAAIPSGRVGYSEWSVECETNTAFGRLDIVVRSARHRAPAALDNSTASHYYVSESARLKMEVKLCGHATNCFSPQ